jgi:DNA repair exonuclease SbcCD ATPase subunit
MSFGNNMTEIDLDHYGSTLITGENVDASSNNGAGKTTIINAICYALYNKPFDNISLQKLINASNNSKNTLMEVRLFLEKGEDEYEIYRCRGENFNINILCNGEDVTLDSVSGNDKFVEEIIGMSYELFTKIIIFSGNTQPFLQLPVSQQRSQIEELFNITLLTEKAILLKEKIKQTEGDINVQEAIIKQQEGAVKLYQKQLKDAEDRVNRWESDREKQAAKLLEQLDSAKELEGFDIDREKELHAKYAEHKAEEATLSKKLALLKKDITLAAKEVEALKGEITHLADAKCPYCQQSFEDAQAKLQEKCELLTVKTERENELDVELGTLQEEIHLVQVAMAELKQDMRFSSVEEALRATQAAATAQGKIDELLAADNPHVEALDALKQQAVQEVQYDELNHLKKELDHQQFLLKLLTDKNSFIRRRIINKTVPFLNARLIHYTKDLGLPHIVKFDDDMSCTVSEYGRELDFGNLSSGEKKRVNLSLSLAFRDVLHHLHAKVNLLFIDEIDASLDSSGVENVFRLLKQKTRDDGLGMWIISHRPEAVGRFDRNIVVRKENGFSQIVDPE